MSVHKRGIKWEPHEHQAEAYHSDARFIVVAAGRRSGKTTLAAVEMVERALRGGTGWRGAWVTPGHSITETGFRAIDDAVADDVIDSRKQSPPYRHEFTSGGRIDYLTTGGDPNVSEGYDYVVIDEAGKDVPERAWTQELRPTLSNTGGEALFISTPDGKDWFHGWWQRGQSPDYPDVDSFRWTTYDAPHIPDAEVDAAREELPERIFEQEYLATFRDDTGGVFDVDPEPYDLDAVEGPYRAGVDLARSEDYLAIVVLGADGRVAHLTRERGLSWPQIQRRVERVHGQYECPVAIDATRDNKVVGDLETAGVDIRPVTFSAQRKQALVENLAAGIEAGEVTVPEDTILATELSVFEYETTRAGNIRYGAPDGHHDDTCFVAGTMIATPNGERPIEKIEPGDMVTTRQGPCPVLATNERDADVISRFGLTGTPDHPLITTEGIRRFDIAKASTLYYIWETGERQLNTRATSTTDTRTQNTTTYATTTGVTPGMTKHPSHFTARSGEMSMETSPTTTSSTTAMATRLTTTSITSKQSHSQNTPNGTRIWDGPIQPNTSRKCSKGPSSGTSPTKGGSGTRSTTKRLKNNSTKSDTRTSVSSAETSIRAPGKSERSSAPTRAGKNTSTEQNRKRGSVPSAETSSTPTSTATPRTAQSVAPTETGRETVYNLSVGGCPEYFANGILVHNCDALAMAYDLPGTGGGVPTARADFSGGSAGDGPTDTIRDLLPTDR